MKLYSLTIASWQDYQPRKDLTKLTWFRIDTGIFNGQSYFLLKNDGLILFIFLLSLAASSAAFVLTSTNSPHFSFEFLHLQIKRA